MLKKLIISSVFITAAIILFGQGITPTGQNKGTMETLGGSKVDSMLWLPVRALSTWQYANNFMAYIGGLQVNPADTLPYYCKTKGQYLRLLTQGDTTLLVTHIYAGSGINVAQSANSYTISATGGGGGGTVTSVGMVAGAGMQVQGTSPITTSGTYTVVNTAPDQTVNITPGIGIAIDGSYPTFTVTNTSPGSSGAGGKVYFLNGSVPSGVAGYEQLSRTAIFGSGTDFSTSADGYIASFLTDVSDPNLLSIPVGNWGASFYMQSSSPGGSPYFYVEIYKYNGSTFTLIASSSTNPEYITSGTSVDVYNTLVPVSATSILQTDRIAIRVYVHTGGRTITLHTEDNNLSQITTTFSTGISALNGLTTPVQTFSVGTGGSDFNISSSTATHTFNLPTADGSHTGKLSSSDWTTFNNKGSGTVTSVGVAAGTGISVSGSPVTSSGTVTVTSTGSVTAGTGVSVAGSWPTYTVTNTSPSSGGTVTSVGAVAGTGISITGTSPITTSGTYTIGATGSLTAGTGISIAGSFPTYTVTNSSPSSGGTVTSFSAAGSTPVFTMSVTNATTTPTLTVTTLNQNPNTFLAGATSGTTTPTFRTIATSDLPATTVYSVVAGANMSASGTNTVTIALQNTINLAALAYSVQPSATATGTLNISATSQNTIEEAYVVPSSGLGYVLQGEIGQEDIGYFTTNGTAIQTMGRYVSAISSSGTSTFNLRTYDASNVAPNELYNKLTGLASANNQVELWFGFTSRDAMIGNAAYGAGSKLTMRFCIPAYVSTQRFFAGYASVFGQLSTTSDPSSLTNIVGIAKDAGDATLQVMFNDGSGTATKVNTGITPNANDEYIVTILMPSNTTYENVCIERRTKTASTFFCYKITTDIPASGTLMYMHIASNSAAVSTAPTIGVMSILEQFKAY